MVSCWMPGDPKECRDHAKTCMRLATSAKTTEAAIVFENLASTWLRLAADLETSAILLDDLEGIGVKKTPPGKS
jgi:hypothetical protein